VIVRISKGRFDPERRAQVEQLLVDSEAALREPLQALPGLLHYYAAIDREKGYVTTSACGTAWSTPGSWTPSRRCSRSARSWKAPE
jgi:hypothetical protein